MSVSPSPDGLEKLHPAYFALVMATGIVSLAAYLLGFTTIAGTLFAFNIVAYPTLWVLYVARIVLYPRAVLSDLTNHARSVGFFTIIAGTCVLGSQFIIIGKLPGIALGLWLVGIFLWALLTYGILTILTVEPTKPTLIKGLNGGWLVAVVATQSVSILGSQLTDQFDWARPPVIFFCLVMWLGGGMLYIWLISLIFYRYTFFEMSAADLAPPYWINMGAVAISTLAGTFLISNSPQSSLLEELLPFIKGMTLLFWATATWWIPMLVTLGFWRHGFERMPLQYDPLYWGAVFPLGMYTVCTYRLATTVDAPFLGMIARISVYVAMLAWTAALLGMLHGLWQRSRRAA